jgi:hypothetical protein
MNPLGRHIAIAGAMLIPIAQVSAQAPDSASGRQAVAQTSAGPRIMAQNRYFAKPGKAEEVYAWRQHASDVLRQLGLNVGQVFRGGGGEQPDAVWQVVIDSATLVREARIAQESLEFQEVMRRMATLVRRIENGNYLQRRLVVDVKDSAAVRLRPH